MELNEIINLYGNQNKVRILKKHEKYKFFREVNHYEKIQQMLNVFKGIDETEIKGKIISYPAILNCDLISKMRENYRIGKAFNYSKDEVNYLVMQYPQCLLNSRKKNISSLEVFIELYNNGYPIKEEDISRIRKNSEIKLKNGKIVSFKVAKKSSEKFRMPDLYKELKLKYRKSKNK